MKEITTIVICGSSGAGKTTVRKYLSDKFPQLSLSISATTRSPRGGEKNNIDYYFLSTEEFRQKIAAGEFFEWQNVYSGCSYGTLNSELERICAQGKVVLFDVDPYGAVEIKEKLGGNALTIFISVPLDQLEKRLRARGTETEADIKTRLDKAVEEAKLAPQNDFRIINNDLPTTCKQAEQIVQSFLNKKIAA